MTPVSDGSEQGGNGLAGFRGRLARSRARLADSPRARRQALLAAASALAVLALVVLVFVLPEDEVEEPPSPPQVEVLVVGPTEFRDWVETTGRVEARADALLTAEAGGTVVSVAREGQAVGAGQVVAQLEAEGAMAAVAQARAAEAEARATTEQAEQAYRRQLPLVEDTIISPLEFEQVRAQRAQARAGLEQARAAVAEAEELLEQTRLRAPFPGVVEERWVRAGEQVAVGQEVVRIVGPGAREVMAGIPERYTGDIQVGATAVVDLGAYDLPDVESSVEFVGGAVDPQSRTFTVRIGLPWGGDQVKADMLARVRVVREVVPDALVVPRQAVLRDEREESVLVVDSPDGLGLVDRRVVTTGPASEEGVLIEAGLEPGDLVVVLGQDQVVAGDSVQVARRYIDLAAFRAVVRAEAGAVP